MSTLEQGVASPDAPAQAVILARAYALRDLVSDGAGLTHFFEGVASGGADPQVREEALRYVALMRVHAGDIDGARSAWNELGLVREWSVMGPFAGEPPAGGQFDHAADYTEGGVTRKWRTAPAIGPGGMLDLTHLFPGVSSGTIAASAVVQAQSAGAAVLKLGAASAMKVFVNGEQVFDAAEARFAFDEYTIGIRLNAGANRVVVALRRSGTSEVTAGEAWQFTARVTAPDGEDLLGEAERAAEANPDSPAAWDTLAEMQELRGRSAAHDSFEQVARMSPSAQRWLRAANSCSTVTCMYAALRTAQELAPRDPEVLTRVAGYYASRRQSEKAAELLGQAAAAAPDDFVAAAMLDDSLAARGRKAEALRSLRALAQRFPDVPWLQMRVGSSLERLGMLEEAIRVYRAQLTREFDEPQLRTALERLYTRTQNADSLRTLERDSLLLDPSDTAAMAAVAHLDAGSGNARGAVAALRTASAAAPGDVRLRVKLADVYAAEGNASQANAELNTAIAARPDDATLRRRARLDGDGSAPADEEQQYTVNAPALAAQARAGASAGNAEAVELADVRIVHVQENGEHTVRSQDVIYIADDAGARDYSTRTITYSPHYEAFQLLHARIFRADGTVVNAEDMGDSGPGDSIASMYYDSHTRTVRYPALEGGDVIELDYRLTPKRNPYGDYFSELQTFGSSLPRRLQRYVVIAPASRPLHITSERLATARETSTATELTYAWEKRDMAPLPSEPKGPPTTEIAPYVHVSTLYSWADVGRWYARLIAPQLKLDATLREVLQRLIEGKNTDEEKIRAIHHFVVANTHYVALEFGIFNYKPYPVSEVYARRFGDCKDKSSLMIALLRAAGIDADLALVRTRRLGDVTPDATSVSVFNHAVVYIPKYDLWLDGTAEYAGTHELPIDDQGAQALTVSMDGEAQLRRIPVTLPMENYTHRQVRAELQPDGNIEFTGSAYTRGEDAPGLRREFEVTELQRTSFQNHLAEVLPSVRLNTVEVNGARDLDSDVIVNFSGDLDTYEGSRIVPLLPSWMRRSYVKTLAPLVTRREDLQLPAPWTTEEELHFIIPQGAKVGAVPADTNLDTPFGTAIVHYHRQGNEIEVRTSVQFRKLRISPAEYPAFRNFCWRVDEAFREKIRVGL